ncbi:MAG: hypothetical protein HGB29_10005 [Chlorobiaceae bacterium]|nr:hypothetical protein [Chlorobiaceae bacterium]NTW75184.1 hypothetical protein [Chlorobiaceae bacterium]
MNRGKDEEQRQSIRSERHGDEPQFTGDALIVDNDIIDEAPGKRDAITGKCGKRELVPSR